MTASANAKLDVIERLRTKPRKASEMRLARALLIMLPYATTTIVQSVLRP